MSLGHSGWEEISVLRYRGPLCRSAGRDRVREVSAFWYINEPMHYLEDHSNSQCFVPLAPAIPIQSGLALKSR